MITAGTSYNINNASEIFISKKTDMEDCVVQ